MRDIKQLNPELQAIIPKFITACKNKGLIIGIGECYRTITEQEALYAEGRTTGTKGAIVTNCRGTSYTSPHQWGVAFDFYRNDGTGAFNDTDGFFAKVGAVGKSFGLEWGGDWTGWVDKPHLQLAKFFKDGTTAFLKKKYGTPDKFMATWTVISDTTCDFTLAKGKTYTCKLTASQAPTVTVGTANIVSFVRTKIDGNDYYYTFTGLKSGGVGVYCNGKKLFIITVKE
jgi:hypothetical protein